MNRASERVRGGILAAVFVAALVALVLAGEARREQRAVRAAFPQVDGRIAIPGLQSRVEVLRDRRGVPHIRAASERDALQALGYVHAQDRLAQMLWLSRSARGRSAESLGAAGLAADRRARLLDIGGHADRQAQRLAPDTAALLAAYSDGVNARLARIAAGDSPPPSVNGLAAHDAGGPEFEPWSPADSLAIVKLWAWILAGSLDESLVLSDLIERFGGLGARPFFPDGGGFGDFAPETEARRGPFPLTDPLRRALAPTARGLGSSAWVVAAGATATGKPILLADTHLTPTVPAFYYEAQVRGGPLDVAGATIAGVPVFWTGRNRHTVWAATHAGAVVVDLYVESLDPDDASRYHDGRRWRALGLREEIIQVRGGEPVTMQIASTRHGPLLGDEIAAGREPLAVAWTGARPGDGVGAFLAVARARSAAELRAALASHHEPVLAVVFADVEGAGGLQVAGWIPRRPLPTGLVPVPGRSRWYDWPGPIPFDQLPRYRLGRDRRWLIAADNVLGRTRGPSPIEWLWREGDRAARIDALLAEAAEKGPLHLGDLVAIQRDQRDSRATAFVAAALATLGDRSTLSAEERDVAALLEGWDGEAGTTSIAASVFHEFRMHLVDHLLNQRFGANLFERYLSAPLAHPTAAIRRIVSSAVHPQGDATGWGDRAVVAQAVRASLHATWIRLSVELGPNRARWTWGDLHQLRFHPQPPARDGSGERELGPFPFAGDESTVAVAGYAPSAPFDAAVISAYRFGADLSRIDRVLTALAPGQAEQVGHPHRADRLPSWRAGRLEVLPTDPAQVDREAQSRLILEPAP